MASVFTAIDYDHIHVLGNSLEEIAYEKAGIIKKDSIVVSYPQKEEVLKVLEQAARDNNSDFYLCPMGNIAIKKMDTYGSVFDFLYKNIMIRDIKISMLGEHQIYNAAIALTTLLILREKSLIQIADGEIKGPKNTKWPGRLEVINREPIILIDGAHNLQGIEQLKSP